VLQTAFLDGQLFNLLSHLQGFRSATVLDVGQGQGAKPLVAAAVVVVVDKALIYRSSWQGRQ
jgi:hypothetical protein